MSVFVETIKSVENDQQLERIHQELMDEPALVHAMDEQGHSVLHWAAQTGPPALVQLLLDHNASLNVIDQRGLVPLHWAAAANNLSTLQVLVNHPDSIIDVVDGKHQTPLLLAAQNGHVLAVLYMLKRGADATIVDANQDNFIHWAAYKGVLEVLTLCHAYAGQFGFDLSLFHALDAFGQSPLHLAASQGHLDCVEYLVEELQTSITTVDAKGNTPWTLAQTKGHAAVFAYLTNKFQPAWNRQLGHALYFWCAHAMNAEAVSLRPFLGPKAPFYFFLGNFVLAAYWNLLVFLDGTQLFLSAFTWACFGCAWHTEAGHVSNDPVLLASYTTVMDSIVNNDKVTLPTVRLCHTCRVEKPHGAKHCRHCRKCVLHFDHHCPYINNCVGQHNYTYFILCTCFLAATSVHLAYLWACASTTFATIVGMVYYGGVGVIASSLLCFHLFLASIGLSTNEYRNRHRYKHLSFQHFEAPCQRDCFPTLLSRLCLSFPWVHKKLHLPQELRKEKMNGKIMSI